MPRCEWTLLKRVGSRSNLKQSGNVTQSPHSAAALEDCYSRSQFLHGLENAERFRESETSQRIAKACRRSLRTSTGT